MTNHVYNPGGYISDRYGQPKPRVTLDVAIADQITLADIRHLIDKAANFADNAKIIVFKDVLRVVQEPTKPVTMRHRGNGHLHFSGPVSGPVSGMTEEELAERLAENKKRSERFPFTGVDMEDGKGTPVTTKIDQPRDHLGRFVKRD